MSPTTRAPLSFGEPVVVAADPDGRVGLVAELRKTDCRVLYLTSGRSAWVGLREVRRARAEEIAGSLDELVRDLLVLLGAVELELTALGSGRFRLVASHGAITPETLDRLREHLGSRLAGCVVRPSGMHRIQTIVEVNHPGEIV